MRTILFGGGICRDRTEARDGDAFALATCCAANARAALFAALLLKGAAAAPAPIAACGKRCSKIRLWDGQYVPVGIETRVTCRQNKNHRLFKEGDDVVRSEWLLNFTKPCFVAVYHVQPQR